MEDLVTGPLQSESRRSTSSIAKHSERWRIERMPAVDRNILRMAIFELMQDETPPAIVIDEAIELAGGSRARSPLRLSMECSIPSEKRSCLTSQYKTSKRCG